MSYQLKEKIILECEIELLREKIKKLNEEIKILKLKLSQYEK